MGFWFPTIAMLVSMPSMNSHGPQFVVHSMRRDYRSAREYLSSRRSKGQEYLQEIIEFSLVSNSGCSFDREK